MFILSFITAGYLLAFRSAVPSIPPPPCPTPHASRERITEDARTHTTRITNADQCPPSAAVPAEPDVPGFHPGPGHVITGVPTSPYPTPPTLPGSCYTTWDDFEHSTATVKTHECYTRTSLVPSAPCPTLSCAQRPSDLVCPLYIKVSSVTVPCATDCCPTTSTVYKPAGPCPTCDPCRIPTEWYTYTTGCVGTPTITEINVVTPAF
ncbi:hypothetical protein F4802DRAFT_559774 [Xylaria palmicola]|nr:hypothetical protein F4802DRAFT_559774 [Xylaria palmicola]